MLAQSWCERTDPLSFSMSGNDGWCGRERVGTVRTLVLSMYVMMFPSSYIGCVQDYFSTHVHVSVLFKVLLA